MKRRYTLTRRMLPFWIVPCLILLSAHSTSAAEDARTILDRAIQAHGGEAKLAKLKTVSAKAKGTVSFGADVSFTLDSSWQWPDRLKNVVTLRIVKPTVFVDTISGDESWSNRDGKLGPLESVKR